MNGAELRRLLDTARQRGQAEQSYRILEEMARRREAPASRRSAAEPRIISMDLGDPLERRDEPVEDDQPLASFPDAEDLTLEREPPRPPHAPARWGWPATTFVAGAALGVAGGLWFADSTRDPPPPSPELAAFQAEVAPPAPLPAPTPEAAVEPAQAAPAETLQPETTAEPEATIAAAPLAAEPAAEPEVAEADACASAPTPADRVICGDPKLQRLQRDLRRAYAEALDAHAERDVLRERQLAWRDARSVIADPDRLAALYEQRIRRLDAATADARRRR